MRKFLSVAMSALLLVGLAGCSTVEYNVKFEQDDTFNAAYTVTVDRDALETVFEGRDGTIDEFLTSYKAYLLEFNKDVVDSSTDDEVIWSVLQAGNIGQLQKQNAQHARSLSVYKRGASDEAVQVYIPIHHMVHPDLYYEVPDIGTLFTSITVTVEYPGMVKEANFNGQINPLTKSVTWGTDDVLKSIQRREPLSATGSIVFVDLMMIGLYILGSIAVVVMVTFAIVARVKARRAEIQRQKELELMEERIQQAQQSEATTWSMQQIMIGQQNQVGKGGIGGIKKPPTF